MQKSKDFNASDLLEIIPLGAGNEVGRSCVILKFKQRTIMFDCGIHPAYTGLSCLPYLDEIDLDTVDICLVTHFHLDHAAAVPYLVEKTDFKGKVFMTHPTRAVYKMLISNYVKVTALSGDTDAPGIYSDKDVVKSMDKITGINFHSSLEYNGIKFTAYNAGHVLGAAMFLVEIAGVKILYTGDFSRHPDRHLLGAEIPSVNPDILIVESTYGIQVHEPRLEREKRFTSTIHNIVARGGKCLLPVFALGRTQELLLILDEYWQAHPELHQIPIFYASSLAQKCMTIYQTYSNTMNKRITARMRVSNPFIFKHISNTKGGVEQFENLGPVVVIASPGMLQSGLSRQLFELWCMHKENGILISGYSVEGTLAKHILTEPEEVTTLRGFSVPLRASIHYVSFSAHSDFLQTSDFIASVKPGNVVLVHGEAGEMMRLKGALLQKFDAQKLTVLSPKNTQAVRLHFRPDKVARTVGNLASQNPIHGTNMAGILVRKNFAHTLMTPEDLSVYTSFSSTRLPQKQIVPYTGSPKVLMHFLNQMFEDIEYEYETLNDPEIQLSCLIQKSIKLVQNSKGFILIEWESNPLNDMYADAVLSIVLHSISSPSVMQLGSTTPSKHVHTHSHNTLDDVSATLSRHYQISIEKKDDSIQFSVKGNEIVINKHLDVLCEDEKTKSEITRIISRHYKSKNPISIDT